MISKLMRLTRRLYPTGRAFRIPIGGELEKLHEGLAESEKQAYNDAISTLDSILPDNGNFTASDASQWEQRLGMITNPLVSLADRKLAIIRKMNHPGDVKARQSADYLQNSLQAAGFTVYVHENIPSTPILGDVIQLNQIQCGQYQVNAQPWLFKVVNSLDADVDEYFVVNSYKPTFVIGGITIDAFANIESEREIEFRQLILRLKPVQSVAFLRVNYV